MVKAPKFKRDRDKLRRANAGSGSIPMYLLTVRCKCAGCLGKKNAQSRIANRSLLSTYGWVSKQKQCRLMRAEVQTKAKQGALFSNSNKLTEGARRT